MLARLRYSLSARLVLLFLFAGVILAVSVSVLLGFGFSRHFRENIHPFLSHYQSYLYSDIGDPPNIDKARDIAATIPAEIHILGPEFKWSSDGEPLDPRRIEHSPHRQKHFAQKFDGHKVVPGMIDDQLVLKSSRGNYDLYFVLPERPGIKQGGSFGRLILLAVLIVLALVYAITRWLFRPVQAIRTGVNRIGAGDLGHRIEKQRNDELGELTDSVNAMADEIESMLEAKRQLLLAISHELRSPLTRARLNLEFIDESKSKKEIEQDLHEIESLTSDLLESERLNTRHAALNLSVVNANQLVHEVITEFFSAAQIKTDLLDEDFSHLQLDPIRVKLLIKNLLANAIRHSGQQDTPPVITLAIRDETLIITVTDCGEGIAADLIPFLSQPFYRADPSRQRKTGGYGLGLYLCRMICEAHDGKLEIESEPGQGTVVRARLSVSADSL